MSSIDRLAAQDAARTYTQNTDVARAGGAQKASQSRPNQPRQATSVDSVTLSDDARSLASARDAVQNAPDVREQKVGEIKQKLSDGTYDVPASVLARAMLNTPSDQA
jgi:negative regulator of flagellin synthesis FlgM